jgi:hypothetical protein
LPTSGPGDAQDFWKIKNPKALVRWAFEATTSEAEGVAVLEFVRDVVARQPDFGEIVDEHTRGDIAPNTRIEVIWTFNPTEHYIEIITPWPED